MMYINHVVDNERSHEIKSFKFKLSIFTAVDHSNPLLRSSILLHVSDSSYGPLSAIELIFKTQVFMPVNV